MAQTHRQLVENTQPRLEHPSQSSRSKLGKSTTSWPFFDEFFHTKRQATESRKGFRQQSEETGEFSAFRLRPVRSSWTGWTWSDLFCCIIGPVGPSQTVSAASLNQV
ncbi:hypothetical protein D8674_031853 [Pyrus ussuriensis x Pyrus communis]|uniref:Uncharacterized protein n=1 Tax=Pyrus ussuriensis x Pyrus communis TaxID=2448454 RepID=A0A5N5F0Z8_9ROSA|nr:hypothetical protein D8674_031853 [Pyrus ussuriensis x Pyrus communis]